MILRTLSVIVLTLGLVTTPAAADLDRRDAVKILGGLAAIYILSEALKREQRDAQDQYAPLPRPGAEPRRGPQPQQSGTYSHIHGDGSGGGGWHEHPIGGDHARATHPTGPRPAQRPAPQTQVTRNAPAQTPVAPRGRVDIKLIPTQCRADSRNAVEVIEGYDAACMQNAVALPGSLPPQCLRAAPGAEGARRIYEAQCLAREGWSTRVARN